MSRYANPSAWIVLYNYVAIALCKRRERFTMQRFRVARAENLLMTYAVRVGGELLSGSIMPAWKPSKKAGTTSTVISQTLHPRSSWSEPSMSPHLVSPDCPGTQ